MISCTSQCFWILLRGEDDWLRAVRRESEPTVFQILGSERRVSVIDVEAVQPVD